MKKRTKIVATIGPSSQSLEKIKSLIRAGMDVARVNFSHGDHCSNGKIIENIKSARKSLGVPVAIMADMQGPRIRTIVDEELEIKKGEIVGIYDTSYESIQSRKNQASGLLARKVIGLDWKGVTQDVAVGKDVLIEDGLMRVRVVNKKKGFLEAEVIEGGVVKNHKGVNIPDANLKMAALTQKDEKDLRFVLSQEVDFIALSFVSNAKEIQSVRRKIKKILGRNNRLPQIVSKIERREAIKNIVEIVKASDAIMVARGDLGIELDENRVVIYQKEIIARCLRMAKPVIVATQMLNSMIQNPRPTRAEVSDVSNAVIDHADAVMLSGETASGNYPVESVKVMSDIIIKTEKSPFDALFHGFLGDSKSSLSSAISHLAHEALKDTGAKAIVAASISGFTARMIARHRPQKPIYVMTNNQKTQNQLNLVWGVQSFVLPNCKTLEGLIDESMETIKKNKLLKGKKERLVIVTGRPNVSKEHMSLVKIEEI